MGSSLGAALVFFTGKQASKRLTRAIEGFSAGVMVAASIWSLLIPSMELSKKRNVPAALPATVGFVLGMAAFLLAERLLNKKLTEKKASRNEYGGLIAMIAVAVHNLPEGMAVGAIFADVLSGVPAASLATAMALSIGIAVQNVPEGAIVSIPIRAKGASRLKAFVVGVLSGIIEPVGALLTVLAAGISIPLLPYLLGFAAGAMMFAVLDGFFQVDERETPTVRILSFCGGFCVMMCLDVFLG